MIAWLALRGESFAVTSAAHPAKSKVAESSIRTAKVVAQAAAEYHTLIDKNRESFEFRRCSTKVKSRAPLINEVIENQPC